MTNVDVFVYFVFVCKSHTILHEHQYAIELLEKVQ